MTDDNKKQAIEWLRDWSKWLTAIDFLAAAGCTIVIQSGAKGMTLVFLVLAASAFALSVLCAASLVGISFSLIERLPEGESETRSRSVLDINLGFRMSLRSLASLQFAFTALGGILFVAWLIAKVSSAGDSGLPDSRVHGTPDLRVHENHVIATTKTNGKKEFLLYLRVSGAKTADLTKLKMAILLSKGADKVWVSAASPSVAEADILTARFELDPSEYNTLGQPLRI